jgi:hypothetical protein
LKSNIDRIQNSLSFSRFLILGNSFDAHTHEVVSVPASVLYEAGIEITLFNNNMFRFKHSSEVLTDPESKKTIELSDSVYNLDRNIIFENLHENYKEDNDRYGFNFIIFGRGRNSRTRVELSSVAINGIGKP